MTELTTLMTETQTDSVYRLLCQCLICHVHSAGSEESSSIKLYLYTYGHQNFLDSGSRKQPTKTYHLSTFGDYEVHLVIMNYLAFNFVICTLVLVASFSF